MAIPVVAESEFMTGKSLRSQTCGMEYNASVVKAMTATLYDYKIEAVVREYSTNITDSHTDAGFPEKKGYVKVPTQLDPKIEFHDTGVGMDEDTIYSVYTVLGCSTKRDDNTTNGSLGFGSKSYAAVADQMTVTSIKDNVKVVVVCYKNKFGELAADLKSKCETEEENGTIVSIPVNIQQVYLWQEACANVLGAFRIPHEVNSFGEYQPEYEAVKSLCEQVRQEGSIFKLNPSSNINLRSKTVVLMGDVLYHLPDFNSLIGNTKIKDVVTNLTTSGLYVTHFNIGDLDHAPSREAISYDPITHFKVRQRVNHDVNKQYKNFCNKYGIGDMSSSSLYKFYYEHRDSPSWDVLSSFKYDFTNGHLLENLDPRHEHSHWFQKIEPLIGKGFGSVKGFIPSHDGFSQVFSSNVTLLNQKRILKIKSPVIVYSNGDKGLYKVKQTLDNIYKSFDRDVLYAESKEIADKLFDWFGCGQVLCGDQYQPEKVTKKRNNSRTSFGVKEDWETVGKVLTITPTGYNLGQGKVNLKQIGVYCTDVGSERFVVKGVVRGKETTLNVESGRTVALLRLCGVTKVVFTNKNNKGKVLRAGTPKLSKVVTDFVKSHKKDAISSLVWRYQNEPSLDRKEKLLAQHLKSYKTLQNKKVDQSKEVSAVLDLSNFHLPETQMYKKKVASKILIINKVFEEVHKVKARLPLFDKLDYYVDEADIEHYLKLEKVIR